MISFSIITNKRKLLQAGLLVILIVSLFSPLMVLGAYQLVFQDKIYPFVKIGPLNVSGLTSEQAKKEILTKIKERDQNQFSLEFEDKTWVLNLEDVDFSYTPQETVRKIYLLGRDEGVVGNFKTKWQLWWESQELPLDFSLNEAYFEEKIATFSAVLDKPAIPPQIKIDQDQVKIEKGSAGQKLNQQKLKQVLFYQLGNLDFTPVKLPVDVVSPEISDEMAEKTRKRAENLLNKELSLNFKDQSWTLNDKELINLLDFQNTYNEPKLKDFIASLAKTIDRSPQDALFNFSAGRVVEFKPALKGQKLNQETSIRAIKVALEDLENGEEKAIINLQVELSEPEITTDKVNNLGIKELIGRGESFFRGSALSRVDNIKLAASRLNGLLIKPGEVFSFNQALGEVSKETGFKEAYVIKEGRTVLGDGGGVCQVSTTLFRAALNAGLPIEERQAHAYRVYYYEQNSQVGLDATVFEPSPDLKFKNDTNHHILIQSEVSQSQQKLNFYLYGTNDGRQIYISESRVWDQIAPPPDKYIDDPTLPTGTIKQIDFKAWGAKASFDWKVTRGEQVLQERTFYSYYKPWQAVFLRGIQ